MQLGFQAASWYQNLILHAEQPARFCAPLLQTLLAEIEAVWTSSWPHGAPGALLLSAAAGRLPGLATALRAQLENWTPLSAQAFAPADADDDFGEDLLADGLQAGPTLVVLPEEAAARAAHVLAPAIQRGELPAGHSEQVPLPLPQPPDNLRCVHFHFPSLPYSRS